MKENFAKKTALRGILIGVAFVLSWVEMQIPYSFAIPGIKLGLTNLVVIIALYCLSPIDAFAINIIRILLVSFTFGNMAAFMYSAAGGVLSFVVMYFLYKLTKLSVRLVSVAGGISHNVGQIVVAIIILDNTKIVWYLPYLWISGIVAGIAIGLLGSLVIGRIRRLLA